MKDLTLLEESAVCFHVMGKCNDRTLLFKIACGEERFNRLKEKSKIVTVNRWFNSVKIQDAIRFYKTIQERQNEEFKKNILLSLETEQKETEPTKPDESSINFLNLDQFLKYANEQANNITDDKEKRAWVEMIGKYMNFKESDEGETEQIKAYLPLQCYSCELKKRCERCKFEVCPV